MTAPERYRAVMSEPYDPEDDEGYRERLVAAWYDSLHQAGGLAVEEPTLEPSYVLIFDEEDPEAPPVRGPMNGYMAVGLAYRESEAS